MLWLHKLAACAQSECAIAVLVNFKEMEKQMPDLLEVFQRQAPKYDRLVSREDYQGNLMPALRSIAQFDAKRIVEFGAGTGRLTRLLAPIAGSIFAFDASAPMLEVAECTMQPSGLHNWRFEVADHRKVPIKSHTADVAIAAWSICCLVAYGGDNWKAELATGLSEMARVVVPDGVIAIIETLGTGYLAPNAPAGLKEYYRILESTGFKSTWIRTDYRFADMDEAVDLTTFFFGQEPLAAIISDEYGPILPECTGIWWKAGDAS
jgi:ubiquinone/menaquinone biosynthesis C-methylase UbiE